MNDWNSPEGKGQGYSPGYPYPPMPPVNRKSKWIAGFLAFFIPGTGHLYLGLMVKGIGIMMLLFGDIFAIAYAGMETNNTLFVVFFSMLLPIIYFYNLFDAIQSTDFVNQPRPYWTGPAYVPPARPYNAQVQPGPAPAPSAHAASEMDAALHGSSSEEGAGSGAFVPPPPANEVTAEALRRGLNNPAVILLGVIAAVLIVAANFAHFRWPFHAPGSLAGAAVLIAAGIGLWLWESRIGPSKKG